MEEFPVLWNEEQHWEGAWKGNYIDNFVPIIPQSLKILAKIFMMSLVLNIGSFIGDAQTYNIPNRSLPDYLHLLWCIAEKVDNPA